VKKVEIYGRYAVLAREDSSDDLIRDHSELYEVCAKASAVDALIFEYLLELLRRNEVLADEDVS